MQYCDCEVRLSGSLLNTVPKQNVSVPEILVLRAIHGPDSVVNIRKVRVGKVSHPAEFDRLLHLYGGAGLRTEEGQATGQGSLNLHNLFPGAIKRLPITLEEAGISLGEELPAAQEPAEEVLVEHDPTGESEEQEDEQIAA